MSVAVRTLPGDGGTEYLFNAEDLPRENAPDMPPAGNLIINVLVAPGQAPVFTNVIR